MQSNRIEQQGFGAKPDDLGLQVRMLKIENAQLKGEISLLKETHASSVERDKNRMEAYREKYERLLEEHRKVVRLNAELEDKLLTMVESIQKERTEFAVKLTELKEKCAESDETIKRLAASCESYKRDCLIATELLHNDPSHFLPVDSNNSTFSSKREDRLSTSSEAHLLSNPSHFLMPSTFPPIAMYSMDPSFHSHSSIGSNNGDSAEVPGVNKSKPTLQPSSDGPAITKILEI
nr:Brain enriched guanylate kinase associated [Hymenolepis microstoma]